MLKKLSIRCRLTILSATLLTFCCIGLTIVLNISAFDMVDSIDAAMITVPSTNIFRPHDTPTMNNDIIASTPPLDMKRAKKSFGIQSAIYMLVVILGGSGLTYYISGKALRPLDILNGQVKNLNVSNLSETLAVPPTKDEITELTQSFNEMTDKLNDAFMTQKRFSASAAHELRTPLAVLQTKLDVFKKKSPHTSDEYDAIINVFEKQITRLRGLVGNLLDMTNMDDEQEQSDICLNDVCEDIISELAGMANDRGVKLKLNCDDSVIFGNLDLLYRALYNLVENGIKYNTQGGTVNVKVRKSAKGKAQILISDSGIGIPNEMKKHIFEPFYRVDKSRSREMGGAGLGLSIVDSIIKKHGGTITALDNKNGGTCFKIEL